MTPEQYFEAMLEEQRKTNLLLARVVQCLEKIQINTAHPNIVMKVQENMVQDHALSLLNLN